MFILQQCHESKEMFLAVSSNQKLSEAVSTVPDQQLSVVQVPVSELGEVVISDDADHPSLSEVVMATVIM